MSEYELTNELIDRYVSFFLAFAQQNRGKCPSCLSSIHTSDCIAYDVSEEEGEIDIYCDTCDHILATIAINSLVEKRPITVDEVLDVHQFLYSDNFEKTLAFYLKNRGNRTVGVYDIS